MIWFFKTYLSFQHPWIASIVVKKDGINAKLKCSATIVDKHFVITAAHCAKQDNNLINHFVVIGSTNLTDNSEKYRREFPFTNEDVFAHPLYPQVCTFKSQKRTRTQAISF